MSVFVAVVAAGSFSAASRQLRMPLPTVSRKVAEIESHLKAKLLVRSTRKLVLTEAGEAYVEDCKRILEESPKPSAALRVNTTHLKASSTSLRRSSSGDCMSCQS